MSADSIAGIVVSIFTILGGSGVFIVAVAALIHAFADRTKSHATAQATKVLAEAEMVKAQAASVDTDVEARKLILTVATGQIANATRIQELEKGNSEQLAHITALLAKVGSLEAALDVANAQLASTSSQLTTVNAQLALANTQMTRLILIGDIAAKPDDTTAAHQTHAENTALDAVAALPTPVPQEVPPPPAGAVDANTGAVVKVA